MPDKHSLEYLKTDNKLILNEDHFLDNHRIFRIKKDRNPRTLAYPQTITELSCDWSKYIIPGDLLRLRPETGGYIFYSTVEKIRNLSVRITKTEATNYDGTHELKCYIYHAPLPKDYAHVQIDILHAIQSQSPDLNETRRYTKENWNKGYNLLRKKGQVKRFFKELREDYKFRLALEFKELPENKHFDIPPNFKEDNPNFKPIQDKQSFFRDLKKKFLNLFKKK